jgi:A/G-specific adenine glycosylase
LNSDFAQALLGWFDRQARSLPWRQPSGGSHRRDPYAVIVSELMLQQTQVTTVIPYYERFMERFPDFSSLAEADETEVLKYWEGLGYYRRARNLHALARQVIDEFNGRLPVDRKQLLGLPGIGPYTAGAIRSFAYDLPEPAVDGNVVRVFARLDAIAHQQGDPAGQRAVRERVSGLIPGARAGDFSEALMELGATVCLPGTPDCGFCPLARFCRALALSRVNDYPVKRKDREKPVSRLTYLLIHQESDVLCQRRPKGLLEGLYEFVSLEGKMTGEGQVRDQLEALWGKMALNLTFRGEERAVFSHRIWEMALWEVDLSGSDGLLVTDKFNELIPVDHDDLGDLPFPAFLVSWRDDFIRRQARKNPGPC